MKKSIFVITTLLLSIVKTSYGQDIYPEDGWWWDADASGRGYMLERQDGVIFMTSFHYSDTGEPEWLSIQGDYVASSETSGGIGELDGIVYRSTDGQTIGGVYNSPVTMESAQNPMSLSFQTNQSATLTWPNETIQLTRFFWSYSNNLEQLVGNWLLTTVDADSISSANLVNISVEDSIASISLLIGSNSGTEIGSISLSEDELTLSLNDLNEDLALLVPETKRFYAGDRTGDTEKVFAVRIDDLPAVFVEDDTNLTTSTDGVFCDYSDTTENDQGSLTITSISDWICSESERSIAANGIPDHLVGEFPNEGNPNTISEQDVSATFTLTPVQTDTATTLGGPAGVTGYVLNGIKIDASTAGSCDDSGEDCSLISNVGNWSIEALGQDSFNFGTDDNNAHVQPDGQYHYHGMPEGFIEKRGGNSSAMTLIGWAADGFPIYARYGYSVADDATSDIVAITGSYQLIEDVSDTRPSADLFALGTFAQDWEYVAGSGDLDECNGRVGVTPEFPQGIYHYYATDTYPYFQRCVKGEVAGGGSPPPR